jgi:chromosome segregation ATPase
MAASDSHIRACELIDSAEMLSSTRTQEWEEAARVADEARAILDPVQPMANSITSSGAMFAEQLATAPPAINALRSFVVEVESEINGMRGEHGKRLSKLMNISNELDKVEELLHERRPNPPLIMEQIDELTASTQDVLEQATEIDRKIRKDEEDARREAERRRREREEQEEADRRRRSSSSSGGFYGGYIGGSSGSSSGGSDFGGGSSGGWSGGGSGGSSGSW